MEEEVAFMEAEVMEEEAGVAVEEEVVGSKITDTQMVDKILDRVQEEALGGVVEAEEEGVVAKVARKIEQTKCVHS